MKLTTKIITLLAAFCATSPASAASVACESQVAAIAFNSDGRLWVRLDGLGGFFHPCGVSDVRQGVPTSTCSAWAGQLLSAQAMGKQVRVHFDNLVSENTDMGATCDASDFNWSYRLPYFIEILN